MNLFIIGNGFDLAHQLPTSYDDFRQYLISKYPHSNIEEFTLPEVTIMPDGDEVYDEKEVVPYLLWIISQVEGEEWRNVEETLGILDFSNVFDDLFSIYDDDGDLDYFKNSQNTEALASSLVSPTLQITDFFSEWINTINVKKASKLNSFSDMIDPQNDLFLTFNYTSTLEELYKIENYCHIHGEQNTELVFGHGNNGNIPQRYIDDFIGAEWDIQKIKDLLKKDTKAAIKNHISFFEGIDITPIKKVYSFGFSFSEVDKIYIHEICKRLSKNVIWYLNDYDDISKRLDYQQIIRSAGFNGKFDTYNI